MVAVGRYAAHAGSNGAHNIILAPGDVKDIGFVNSRDRGWKIIDGAMRLIFPSRFG